MHEVFFFQTDAILKKMKIVKKSKNPSNPFKSMFFSKLSYKNVDNIVKNYKSTFGRKEMFDITLP